MNAELALWLADLRQHPLWPALIAGVPTPRLSRFKTSKIEDAEAAKARWIFESGQLQQHENWTAFLTGGPSVVVEFEI